MVGAPEALEDDQRITSALTLGSLGLAGPRSEDVLSLNLDGCTLHGPRRFPVAKTRDAEQLGNRPRGSACS